jgi:hypothetical protein
MIASAADFLVRSPKDAWTAHHHPEKPSGPSELCVGDTPIVRDVRCIVGKFGDELASLSTHRQFRKNNAQVVLAEGYLPFGAEIRLTHTHRYFDGILRVTSDLHFPRGARANPCLEVGSMDLPGVWTDWREPGAGWQPLATMPASFSPIPPTLLLRHASGAILELGLGNDIWRWQAGLLPEDNRCSLAISATEGGLQVQRIVSESEQPMPPLPRTYRFSWYLAWLPGPAPVAEFAAEPTTFDLRAIDFGKQLCRPDDQPCMSAGPVGSRLKAMLRKLHGDAPIAFSGLTPGCCDQAKHVKRKKPTLHSDVNAIIEFAAWTRKIVGPDRQIVLLDADVAERPLLANLFRVLPLSESYLMADTTGF